MMTMVMVMVMVDDHFDGNDGGDGDGDGANDPGVFFPLHCSTTGWSAAGPDHGGHEDYDYDDDDITITIIYHSNQDNHDADHWSGCPPSCPCTRMGTSAGQACHSQVIMIIDHLDGDMELWMQL